MTSIKDHFLGYFENNMRCNYSVTFLTVILKNGSSQNFKKYLDNGIFISKMKKYYCLSPFCNVPVQFQLDSLLQPLVG